MFAILAIYNNETWPNSIHYFAKRIKILSFTKKPSKKSQSLLKFCQSGEFSPNLVTLFPRLSLLLVNPRPWVVLHLYFFQLKSSLQLGTPKSCDKKDYGKNELTKVKYDFFFNWQISFVCRFNAKHLVENTQIGFKPQISRVICF